MGRAYAVTVGSTSGQLAPGVRASAGAVGFLGVEGGLIQLSPGDPLGALSGSAVWDGNSLKVTASNFTLAGYKLDCMVIAQAGTGTFTVDGCVIDESFGNFWGAYTEDPAGKVVVRDTTIRVPSRNGTRALGIGADSNLVEAYRCDVSGFEDCIAMNGPSVIDQCYLHGLDDLGADPHNDVIQHYAGAGGTVVTNCYLVATRFGAESDSAAGANAALSFHDDGCVARNNFMDWGGWVFRIEGATNVHFTDNDFGPNHAFGEVDVAGSWSVVEWSNNRDSGGSLIPEP